MIAITDLYSMHRMSILVQLILSYPQTANFDLNRTNNPVNNSNRMEKIQKYQDKKNLETKLEEMEKRTHVEEEVRKLLFLSFSLGNPVLAPFIIYTLTLEV